MHFRLTIKYNHEIGNISERANISTSNIFLPYMLNILKTLDAYNKENIVQCNLTLDFLKSLHEEGLITTLEFDLIRLFVDEDIEDYEETADTFLFNYHFDAQDVNDKYIEYIDEFDQLFDISGGQESYVYRGFKLKIKQ